MINNQLLCSCYYMLSVVTTACVIIIFVLLSCCSPATLEDIRLLLPPFYHYHFAQELAALHLESNMSYASPSYSTKLSSSSRENQRGKSPGWAAFGRKQRQEQGLLPPPPESVEEDPYPPMPSPAPTPLPPYSQNLPTTNTNAAFHAKPFSSVLLPTPDFPPLTLQDRSTNSTLLGGPASNETKASKVNNRDLASSKLKELHSWADSTLIEDVMAAVDNDVHKASSLLESLVSPTATKSDTLCNNSIQDGRMNGNLFPGEGTPFVSALAADIADLSSTLEHALKDSQKELSDAHYSSGKRLSDDAAANMKLILGHLRSVPVEPEWEEDDVYLFHRKEALRAMRSASQHSRAATNAFLRGDHFSAQQHSKKAREGWAASELLNSKAANDILSVRNSKNDPWKLDLHGLHAREAVQALQDHLLKIENLGALGWPTSSNSMNPVDGIEHSSSGDSFSNLGGEKLDKKQVAFRQRPYSLQIITGVGIHSRGEAALPSAVRSFLSENRYRFDETRPGVITVRPKFRH